MGRIYLDNACTTYPKPSEVADAVYKYMTENGANVNRGSYGRAYEIEETVIALREKLCALFNGSDAKNVIFTRSATEGVNLALKGYLGAGDHVIISGYEHNAVVRPLVELWNANGVRHSKFMLTDCGRGITYDDIAGAMSSVIMKETKAVVVSHGCNVDGRILPLELIGKFCHEAGLKFIVDCAQTAGSIAIDMRSMNIDALIFAGHKGLYGPQGIGGVVFSDEMAKLTKPLISGGTGSLSSSLVMPDFMPDKFEAGTLNIPGIVGLNAALDWIGQTGVTNIHRHEYELAGRLVEGLKPLEDEGLIRIVSAVGRADDACAIVSVVSLNCDLSDVAFDLEEDYGIMTRVGLHCNPTAHTTLGTMNDGTIRFSIGYFNTEEEIDAAIAALDIILHSVEEDEEEI